MAYKSKFVHGCPSKKHPLYRRWTNIIQRCSNPNNDRYDRYGGRGITMYEPWIHDFKAFAEWVVDNLGWPPTSKHQLDRIDNNGNYEPDKLRWATSRQNNNNREISKLPNVRIDRTKYDKYRIRVSMYGCTRDTEMAAREMVDKFYAEFSDDLDRMTAWMDKNKR